MFQCPRCRVDLNRTLGPGGLFWHCPACDGRAVTLPPVRRVAKSAFVNTLWRSACDEARFGAVACPSCRRPMKEIPPRVTGKSTLDVCQPCQMIWFDPKEYDEMPASGENSSPDTQGALSDRDRAELAALMARESASPLDLAEAVPNGPDAAWKIIPACFGMPVKCETSALVRKPWITCILAAMISVFGCFALTSFPYAENMWGKIPAFFASLASWKTAPRILYDVGFVPSHPFRAGGSPMILSLFVHAGFVHLAATVYYLLTFGGDAEDFLGRKKFALLLAASAAAGILLQIVFRHNSDTPSVGASSAVAGVLAFYALRFPNASLAFFSPFLFFLGWMRMPAIGFLASWIVVQLLGWWTDIPGFQAGSAPAHFGGALAGAAFWYCHRKEE